MLKQNLSIDKRLKYKNLYGVYKITNIKTGDFYIGSGKLRGRYSYYRSIFNRKDIPAKSWLWENNNKLEDFEFEVIELYPVYNKDILRRLEQKHKDLLIPNLNKAEKTTGGNYSGELNPIYGKPMSRRKPILQFDLEGNLIKEWEYIMQVDISGFIHQHVNSCCKGKRKTHKGYKWKYKYE